MHIVLSCPSRGLSYKFGCSSGTSGAPSFVSPNAAGARPRDAASFNPQCQLRVTEADRIASIKIEIPLFPAKTNRDIDPVDGSLSYYKGENLAFDMILKDIYGNTVTKKNITLDEQIATFSYNSTASNMRTMTFQKVQHNGIVSFYLSDADNLAFRQLPSKAGSRAYDSM